MDWADQFTFTIWVGMEAVGDKDILDKFTYDGKRLCRLYFVEIESSFYIVFDVYFPSTVYNNIVYFIGPSVDTLDDLKWHFLAVTLSSVESGTTVTLWVDEEFQSY
mmetsp:Transcript_5123/g.2882  ORF Transcript_5123/g.2882 Transcript_5123/m.2882 type:complete len:106 (-) Transcript_5123:191-508(-)